MRITIQLLAFILFYLSSLNSVGSNNLASIITFQNGSNYERMEAKNIDLINAFQKQEFEGIENMLAPEIKLLLDAEKLKQTWKMLTSTYGSFVSYGKSIPKITAEKTTVLTSMKFEKETLDLSTSMDSEGRINSLNILQESNKELWEFPLYGRERNANPTPITIGEIDPLLGELLEPKTNNKVAIVVFTHGSGPNDMDESLGPNKPFKDLAYGLANRGIASLRYNKRTYDYQSKMAKIQNEIEIDSEMTDDAVLAIQYAKSLGYDKVFFAGHSLGGHMAPKIANLEKLDGVIILAGNSSPLVDLLVPQFEYLYKNDSSSGITKFQLNGIKAQVAKVQSGDYDNSTHPMMLPLSMSGIYWQSLDGYDPPKVASKQKQPYLILNGGRDYQVDVAQAKAWKNGNDNKFSKTIIFENLNHAFFGGQGLCLPAEYSTVGHVDIKVIEAITNWIKDID